MRVISYDNPTDPTAEKTAKALLYSDIAEKNNFDSENNTVSCLPSASIRMRTAVMPLMRAVYANTVTLSLPQA